MWSFIRNVPIVYFIFYYGWKQKKQWSYALHKCKRLPFAIIEETNPCFSSCEPSTLPVRKRMLLQNSKQIDSWMYLVGQPQSPVSWTPELFAYPSTMTNGCYASLVLCNSWMAELPCSDGVSAIILPMMTHQNEPQRYLLWFFIFCPEL